MFFKKKNECKCTHEFEEVGKFYEIDLTKYRDCFDIITIYKKYRCLKCHEQLSKYLGSKEFKPTLYNINTGMDLYIKKIEEQGVLSDIDMNEKLLDLKYLK